MSKLTSAQSTLCINNTSVVRFKRNNIINKAYGSTINENFKITDVKRVEDKTRIFVTGTHDAYLKNYGYLHKREINLKKGKYCNWKRHSFKKEKMIKTKFILVSDSIFILE